MAESLQNIGKQISFSELFDEFGLVSVPIIQRDYAQGRAGQEELRREFLAALRQALDKEDGPALDLDFIYGSVISHGPQQRDFAPLDGQQRLTTLFLLHWYLAWKDGRAEEFIRRFATNLTSRFTYEVRPSSHDFFSQLAVSTLARDIDDMTSLQVLIEDQPWFFRSWVYDPTIVSAITMLEEIHKVFSGVSGYFERLISADHPRITFHMLELSDFGLSDDLYIKMNARGKPLTQLETFKARLEQHLSELLPNVSRTLDGRTVSITEYFSHRMDKEWANLFWPRRDPQTNLYDQKVMRLIKALVLVCLDPADEAAADIVSELRAERSNLSFSRLLEAGCLNSKMIETLISLLDYWSETELCDVLESNATAFDSLAAFDGATSRELPYPDLVKFAAYCAYVRTHEASLDVESFSDWLRVVINIVENSDIERPSDFVDALRSLACLEAHADSILKYLVEGSEVPAFNRQQVREERIKAALLLKGPAWREKIVEAERHGYFRGQIEFLLKFSGVLDFWNAHNSCSWTDDKDVEIQEQFSNYFDKASAVFDSDGLRSFDEYKWERALLTLGDYTLASGKNKSFLQNKSGSGERRPTWKLLLRGHINDPELEHKRQLVCKLLDIIDIDKGVELSLDEQISGTLPDELWRQPLVERPELIAYCGQRMFRFSDYGSLYLISKYRTSSDHVELWTYYLYQTLLARMRDAGDLNPYFLYYLPSNNDDSVPAACLTWDGNTFALIFQNGNYYLSLSNGESKSNQYLIARLRQEVQIVEDPQRVWFAVRRDEVESPIRQIVQLTREYEENSE